MHLVTSMAYANETPWHGLGNQLAPNQPIEMWARQAGMNWQIEEAEVRFVSGNVGSTLGSIHAFPEQKVLYRSDTKAPLSVVSRRFNVVQPLRCWISTAISRKSAASSWKLLECSKTAKSYGLSQRPARAPR